MQEQITFPITYSGIRPEETKTVLGLLTDAGLTVQDLNDDKLVHFIAARSGDTVAGVVGLEPAGEHALLRSLAVAADFRNQAVAAGLVTAIEKYARSNGVKAIYLLTMDAAGFFAKQGYHPIKRKAVSGAIKGTEEFRTLCPDTAQCMVKQLSHRSQAGVGGQTQR
jgi:amino-acid N-acetyltransferase